jgi:tellurite methyltransferase
MTKQDAIKWNTKHNERIVQSTTSTIVSKPIEPNTRLVQLSTHFNGGQALDIACGLGANSIFLAKNNYNVTSLDVSDVAIQYLQSNSKHLSIDAKVVDLDNVQLVNRYNLVVITYFLDRHLFPLVRDSIKSEGGLVFIETFYNVVNKDTDKCHLNNHISSQFKLAPNELKQIFSDWIIEYYEENETSGIQTILARKP